MARDPLSSYWRPNKMNRKPVRRFEAALFVLLVASVLFPPGARAQSDAIDVTATFRNAGVDVDHLLVYQISGIVLMRGTTADRMKAEEAGRVARNLGYERIANLIEVVEPGNDRTIVQSAEGSLGRHRSLDGCKFHIDSVHGVVRIGGSVERELQKDYAIDLLRKIKGVKEVHSDLTVL
jgi:osmotically-inducible protein OsmY